MNDREFLKGLNHILAEGQLILPTLEAQEPSAETIAAWASFLESAVRAGIRLSDGRWARLTLSRVEPYTVFDLQGEGQSPTRDDFAVGLQLLMGMLEGDRS